MSENTQYGGFLVRFVAHFIDSLILGFIGGTIGGVLGTVGAVSGDETVIGLMSLIAILLGAVIAIIYYAYFESSDKQATPGKMTMGLKVINKEGGKISFMNAVGRYFAKVLSGVIIYIGYIMIAFDEKKQGLHDKLASTYVVKSK